VNQTTKIFIGVLIIIAAVGYLMFTGFSSFSGYEVGISELLTGQKDYNDEYLLVPGKLIGDSVNFNGDKVELVFTLTDIKGEGYQLPVVYNDVKPDNFDDGADVILEGYYDKEDNLFKAEKVTTKCPSKYEGVEEGAETPPQGEN